MPIVIETDHKHLIPLLSSKHLDSLPPRVLRFRLRLMRFNYSVSFVPGILLYTVDTLSRSPQQSTASQEQQALRLEVQVIHLTSTTTSSVINAMKSVFARHGIPSTLVSDDGPQFTSSEMQSFASSYGFQQVTSSPYFPKAMAWQKGE